MPRYTYQCAKCKKLTEMIRPVGDRKKPVKCDCGGKATQTISLTAPPKIQGGTPRFYR